MYRTSVNEEEKEKYGVIEVDGRKFFYLKGGMSKKEGNLSEKKNENESEKKENLLKNSIAGFKNVKKASILRTKKPLVSYRDLLRKVRILHRHRSDISSIEDLKSEWKECIDRCMDILSGEYGMEKNGIIKAFELQKFGYEIEDSG